MTQVVNFGQDSDFAGNKTGGASAADGNNNGSFYYTPPAGYLAVCSANLADPSIVLPGENFNAVLWSGVNAAQSITGVGFQPDMLWFKSRNSVTNNRLQDSIRGATNALYTNTSGAEGADDTNLNAFDSDGFSMNQNPQSGGMGNFASDNYVGWNWKGGGAPTTDNVASAGAVPTAGSVKINGSNYGSAMAGTLVTKRMSANTTAGFSIVEFDGNSTGGATIAHGLSVAPDMVILKDKNASSTYFYVGYNNTTAMSPGGWNKPAILSLTGAGYDDTGYFWDTAPSSSVVTLGQYTDVNGTGIMAYCFASIEGYSKIGTYKGNGNVDGTFVYTGFEPEFFLIKNVGAIEGWNLWDSARETYNKMSKKLSPNTTDAEYTANTTTYAIDFCSNGVKLRTTYSAVNATNDFLYYAIAKSPFKTSRAR
jgi:hypothetical protein